MKRLKFSICKVFFLLIAPLWFTSCDEQTEVGVLGNVKVFVMNAIAKNGELNFHLDSGKFNSLNLGYGQSFGYDSLPGGRKIMVSQFIGDTTMTLNKEIYLAPYKMFSIYITPKDSLDKELSYVAVIDNTVDATSRFNAKIRFVHLSLDAKNVDIHARVDSSSRTAFTNIYYKTVSVFQESKAGNYSFYVFPRGNNTDTLATISNVQLEARKNYTILFSGLKENQNQFPLKLSVQNNF